MLRDADAVTECIIHCADTPNGLARFTAADIDSWHKERGFHRDVDIARLNQPALLHIGYQKVIHIDGVVVDCRAFNEVGGHCAGHNVCSVGWCMIGCSKFTRPQWEALRLEAQALLSEHPYIRFFGHRDFESHKTCPGFEVATWLSGGMEPLDSHVFERRK